MARSGLRLQKGLAERGVNDTVWFVESAARQGVPVDIPEIAALIAPRAFLDISVLNDSCFSHEASVHLRDAWWKLSELYTVLGAPERFACLTHRGGHSFPHFARACAYSWLEQQLMAG